MITVILNVFSNSTVLTDMYNVNYSDLDMDFDNDLDIVFSIYDAGSIQISCFKNFIKINVWQWIIK